MKFLWGFLIIIQMGVSMLAARIQQWDLAAYAMAWVVFLDLQLMRLESDGKEDKCCNDPDCLNNSK